MYCFFRRRIFLVCCGFYALGGTGIINGVILLNRMTPFTTKDMANLKRWAFYRDKLSFHRSSDSGYYWNPGSYRGDGTAVFVCAEAAAKDSL